MEEGSTGRRELGIPELSLVVLIGVSGSGKTTFARQHFGPFEVLSSDFCRGLVADDENDQAATADAFDVLAYIAGKRLAAGRLTVVDATNVQPAARKMCCPSRSCWTCRKTFVRNEIPAARTARSERRSFTASMTSCAGRCAD